MHVFGDNQAALKLVRNPLSSTKTKHIDNMHHFVRERVLRKEVAFHYIGTDHMLADGLTKALAAPKHQMCCEGVGMVVVGTRIDAAFFCKKLSGGA